MMAAWPSQCHAADASTLKIPVDKPCMDMVWEFNANLSFSCKSSLMKGGGVRETGIDLNGSQASLKSATV